MTDTAASLVEYARKAAPVLSEGSMQLRLIQEASACPFVAINIVRLVDAGLCLKWLFTRGAWQMEKSKTSVWGCCLLCHAFIAHNR